MRILLLSAVLVAVVGCRGSGSDSNVLLRVQPEMSGANCATGGVAVQSGFDLNANATLDDDEVVAANTRYICNGANGTNGANGQNGMDGQPGAQGDAGTPGVNALSQVTQEMPGTNCQYGGTRVDVGPDSNGNGTLETGEITSTRYICDRASIDAIYFGDIRLRDADDLAQLDGIQVVIGDVNIEATPTGTLSLPTLRIISGQLSAGFGGGGGVGQAPLPLTAISLPALTQTGGVNITDTSDLTSISLPQLARSNSVEVTYNGGLTALDLHSLVRVDYLRIESNSVLTSLAFDELTTTEYFRVQYNDQLATLTAPLLRQADEFQVQYDPMLSHCTVYRLIIALTRQPGYVSTAGNDETPTCTVTDTCRQATNPAISGTVYSVQPLDFATARTRCTSIGTGADLLWVETDAEWLALKAAVQDGSFGYGWIGYSDTAIEGTWAPFVTTTNYDVAARSDFWSFGEPNGGTMENAAELMSSGVVNDLSDTALRTFLCRVP